MKDFTLLFRWASEDVPGPRWRALFDRLWDAYRAWFLTDGDAARPPLRTCRKALLEHMPELVPTWERLTALAGGDEEVARMLSLYRPARYLSGCTQAVLSAPAPTLVRNYDYHPYACEATMVRTCWMGTTVVGASDCLWGLLDGVNEHGLAVALSFGGSEKVGKGFGIPLVLRYVLESCSNVGEAARVLRRIPTHMAYNVSIADSTGEYRVAYLRPGASTEIVREPVTTNHQRTVSWKEHARRTRSVERKRLVQAALPGIRDPQGLVNLFLEPPLFAADYERGHGTLYTALYTPGDLSAAWHWRGASVTQTVRDFSELELQVPLRSRPD